MAENIGKIKQVLGAVVDVSFEEKLPQILDALVVKHENKDLKLLCIRGLRIIRFKHFFLFDV